MDDEEKKEIATLKESSLVTTSNIGIEGLEDVSASVIPIPWLKLVQPTSQKVDTKDGEAAVGSFYYTDTHESFPSIKFSLLRAKQGTSTFERDGELTNVTRIAMLGYDLEHKRKFIMTVPVTSFSNFGSLVAQLKQAGITKTFEYELTVTSEKQENNKGKYYVVKFELGGKVPAAQLAELEEMKMVYGMTLDRNTEEEKDLS